MPARLHAPVLTVDVGLMHKVDTRNAENLFSMWTVFSTCSASLEQGRRLENLSWRLWNRETFCCDPVSQANATTPAISCSARTSEGRYSGEVPSLSASLESIADDEGAPEFDTENSSVSAPLDIPHFLSQRTDSSSSSRSRGRERHITPDDLEKMVIDIKEKKDLAPLDPSRHSYLAPLAERISVPPQTVEEAKPQTAAPVTEMSLTSEYTSELSSQPSLGSTATSEQSTTSIVRGFSPSHASFLYRSPPAISAPSIPEADLTTTTPSKGPQPKKHTMFALGGSSAEDSMSEQTNSSERCLQPIRPKKKGAMFSFGGSSNEEESSLPPKMQSGLSSSCLHRTLAKKKQTSFKEEVATRTIHEDQSLDDDVFETDEEDDIDESAIDDEDDSSDWEDSVEDSGNPSIDEKTFFQRVDSRPNLVSRRSMITTMLHQSDRASALAQAAATTSQSTPALQRSRTTSPNGPSLATSQDSDDAGPLTMKRGLKPISEIPRSSARPMAQTASTTTPHLAISPRTTRRKMINDELTVSLRQHLVHEHRQKSQTANAVLQRRHTTQDMANLRQYPERVCMDSKEGDVLNASWNQYFGQGLGEYNSQGW